jgi:hypothetical protein
MLLIPAIKAGLKIATPQCLSFWRAHLFLRHTQHLLAASKLILAMSLRSLLKNHNRFPLPNLALRELHHVHLSPDMRIHCNLSSPRLTPNKMLSRSLKNW